MKPSGYVSRCRGFPMAHPVPAGNARASMPAPLRAFRPRLTGPHGDPKSRSVRSSRCLPAFVLDLPGPHEPRRVAQAAGGDRRDCSSAWMREFAPAAGAEQRRARRLRSRRRAVPGCRFFGLPFFGQAKKGNSAAAEADETLRKHPNQKQKKPHAPRAHENTDQTRAFTPPPREPAPPAAAHSAPAPSRCARTPRGSARAAAAALRGSDCGTAR